METESCSGKRDNVLEFKFLVNRGIWMSIVIP